MLIDGVLPPALPSGERYRRGLGSKQNQGKTFLTVLMNDQLICCLEIGVHEGIVCPRESPILRGEL